MKMDPQNIDTARMQESLDRIYELGEINAIERVAKECATRAGQYYAAWQDKEAEFHRGIAAIYQAEAAKLREAYNQKRKAV